MAQGTTVSPLAKYKLVRGAVASTFPTLWIDFWCCGKRRDSGRRQRQPRSQQKLQRTNFREQKNANHIFCSEPISTVSAVQVFLGDQSVGKTSIITRFMYDKFDNTYQVCCSGAVHPGALHMLNVCSCVHRRFMHFGSRNDTRGRSVTWLCICFGPGDNWH